MLRRPNVTMVQQHCEMRGLHGKHAMLQTVHNIRQGTELHENATFPHLHPNCSRPMAHPLHTFPYPPMADVQMTRWIACRSLLQGMRGHVMVANLHCDRSICIVNKR
jgi:hypothetical protein